jgi:hypothetical protein
MMQEKHEPERGNMDREAEKAVRRIDYDFPQDGHQGHERGRRFPKPAGDYRMIGASVTDDGWRYRF